MERSVNPSLMDLIDGSDIKELEQIAKGLEYSIFLSKNGRCVIKVPRTYCRLLGIANPLDIERNLERCKKYVEENDLPVLIPMTWIVPYRDVFAIVQEYIQGETNIELTKKLAESTVPLSSEQNFVDFRIDNILYSSGKAYLIDVSGGFYYRFANKYGRKASKILWHMLQIGKVCFNTYESILYKKEKIYIDAEYAKFLEDISLRAVLGKRVRILLWHLAGVYNILRTMC